MSYEQPPIDLSASTEEQEDVITKRKKAELAFRELWAALPKKEGPACLKVPNAT